MTGGGKNAQYAACNCIPGQTLFLIRLLQNGHTPEDFIRQINSEYDKLNGDTSDDSS